MVKAFEFLKLHSKEKKPRKKGVIEIRGSYYSPVTYTYLKDLFAIAGDYIDGFKFAGGSQRLHDVKELKKIIKLCHKNKIYVNTGGFVERLYADGMPAVEKYLKECKKIGFDVVEVSSGLYHIPLKDKVAIVKKIIKLGMKPKPELGFMEGAGAGTHIANYKPKFRSTKEFFKEVDAYKKAGATFFMFESEGITEDIPVKKWRKDLIKKVVDRYGWEMWMFEAADPIVFKWYLKQFGRNVNLFVDHTQIIEYEAWRSGLWGDPKLWK